MRPVLCLFLVACSARLGGTGRDDDRETGPDAAVGRANDAAIAQPDGPVVAADNACGVASTQGNLGNLSGLAGVAAQGTTTQQVHYVDATSPLTAMQAAPDVLSVELWDDFGIFTGGAATTGTFTIAGDETDYDTCGVCVLMLANVTNDTPSKLMIATAGTVTVTSIGSAAGQTTQLTVSNVSFVEIAAVQDQGYQPVAGSNCASPISNAVVTGTL